MEDKKDETEQETGIKNIETNPDSGKVIYDDKTGIAHRPDKRKMYKGWFEEAKAKAVEAGFVRSSLISLDEIKGIKKPEITKKSTTKQTASKTINKKRK